MLMRYPLVWRVGPCVDVCGDPSLLAFPHTVPGWWRQNLLSVASVWVFRGGLLSTDQRGSSGGGGGGGTGAWEWSIGTGLVQRREQAGKRRPGYFWSWSQWVLDQPGLLCNVNPWGINPAEEKGWGRGSSKVTRHAHSPHSSTLIHRN